MNEILMEQYLKIYENKSKFNDAFWKWFGDSKVVDTQGNPLVVYHGAQSTFDSFNFNKDYSNEKMRGLGNWFSEMESVGKRFATKRMADQQPKLFACYIVIENPKIFKTYKNLLEDMGKRNGKSYRQLLEYNYDGIIITEAETDYEDKRKDYVVFSPNQIKSIDNKGSWSSSSNNIYEKVSDIEHLTDEITYFVKLRLNELHGKIARYTRKNFQYEKKLSNGNILDVFITLDHTKSYKNSIFQYGRELVIGTKELVDFQGNFSILDNREVVNKILSVAAHEITHYSQVIDKKIDVDSYDETNHSKMEVEHEAKLVELFSLIKSKEYDQALELLYTRSEYFESISWESFLEGLAGFGISEHEERMFEKYLFEYSINLKEFFHE